MRLHRHLPSAALALLSIACDSNSVGQPETPPPASLDAQVRQALSNWGVVPILALKTPDPALVDLGRALFFDKVLSGNRDVSCATCHSPLTHSGDAQSLAVGTGAVIVNGSRRLGPGRQFTPRNAPSLFNVALGSPYMFWDGRVSQGLGSGPGFQTPAGLTLPPNLSSLLAAQATIPVTNRVEMRGVAGDRDVLGNPNELAQFADSQNAAIWDATMRRVLAISSYLQKFSVAYPGLPTNSMGFQQAANAIAAFEAETFAKTNSAFDRYLARDDNALSPDAKQGALLFFGGKARCSSCHNGALLAQGFANAGVPQLGPGTGSAMPLDGGREDIFGVGQGPGPFFFFRVPPLRNVELTAPYMHNGAYATLEAVVAHYNNVDSALKAFDVSTLDPALRASYHGDAATITKVLASTDGRLRQPLGLSAGEQKQLVAFLKSLTDPSARDLSSVIPVSVPSGLPVRE